MTGQTAMRREKPKKAASLTMRLTQRTRTALEEAATAEGRSISEMAERWLDLAAQGKADMDARLGGGAMAETMLTLAAFAEALGNEVAALNPDLAGIDPTNDVGVRAALVGGVGRLFALVYPIRRHGSSSPDPQPFRHGVMQACLTCRSELSRIMAPADAQDLDAFDILSRCSMGDLTQGVLERLTGALARISVLGDQAFKESVGATTAALAAFGEVRAAELSAVVQWSVKGRILAETIARDELSYRVREQAMRVQGEMPGTPFSVGAIHQWGRISNASHLEWEQAIEVGAKDH